MKTDDIEGAYPKSKLKMSLRSSNRNLDPLNPSYQYPGRQQITNIYGAET